MSIEVSASYRKKITIPVCVIIGYLSIAVFMTGDGFEQAFLSHLIVEIGFTKTQASFVFTVYGLIAGLAGCCAGILAEIYGPKKIMLIGAIIWLIFHSLFLKYGVEEKSYSALLAFYSIRAIGYPFFVYSFVVLISRVVPPNRLASAMGWFWTVFVFGLGTAGSYIPSMTIPAVGKVQTLWLAMIFIAAGALIGYAALSRHPASGPGDSGAATGKNKLKQLTRGVELALENRALLCSAIMMTIAPIAIFGFAVIMPFFFIDTLGFTASEWLRIWGTMLFVNMIMNTVTGIIADRVGWMRIIRWQGCIGLSLTTLLFYYLPAYFGKDMTVALIIAAFHGACLTGLIPISAVFSTLAPDEKGAAISLHNLSMGLGTFVGPAIATLLLSVGGTAAVVWVYAGLYLSAILLTKFIPIKHEEQASAHAASLPIGTIERA